MHRYPISRIKGLTLIELIMSIALMSVLGLAIASYMYSGASLYVRNASINHSNSSLRKALDRLSNSLQCAREVPTLINTAGATVATGPAAGLRYDRFLAEPYVLDPAFTATTIAATATSLKIVRSTAGTTPIPKPSVGDILLVDTPTGKVRGRITSVSEDEDIGSNRARVTVTFSSTIGRAISWVSNEAKQASLVRHEAFVVMPKAGKYELRYFPLFDPVPDPNDASKYIVITDQLETNANDKPFSLVYPNSERMVQVNLRVRAQQYNRWLSSREKAGFNSFAAINMRLPSRLHTRTQDPEG